MTYVVVDPSGPTIDKVVTGTLGNNDWYTSDVGLTWLVADPESPGSVVETGCVDQGITADQGATTYTCSATSAGGAAGPISVVIKRDATNPTIGGSSSFAPNAHGWSKTDVLVSFACDDALSGVASCTSPVTLSSDGDGLSVTEPRSTTRATPRAQPSPGSGSTRRRRPSPAPRRRLRTQPAGTGRT